MINYVINSIFNINFYKALQVTGSILLLIHCIPFSRKSILKSFFGNNFSSMDGNSKAIIYNKASFKNHCESIIISLISVIYIVCGFIIEYFTLDNEKQYYVFILWLFVLIIFTKLLTKVLIKIMKRFNLDVTYQELEKYNLKTNIQSISTEDIENVLKK